MPGDGNEIGTRRLKRGTVAEETGEVNVPVAFDGRSILELLARHDS